MRIVVIGHVDHGKSSLIGRLFHEAGALPEGRRAQLQMAADQRGVPFEWANLTDGLQAERDQNVTIDTTQIVLRGRGPNGADIVFIDAPGHRQFLRNMITGATQADAALLVVDASAGINEETRRHALLISLIGVTDVITCVTKIDLVDDARVADVSRDLTALVHALGLTILDTVAVSSRTGAGFRALLTTLDRWCGPSGPRGAVRADPSGPRALVFSVQDVYRVEARRVLVGRVESGSLAAGVSVTVLPLGQTATLDPFMSSTVAGDLQVPGVNALTLREPLFVTRGDVLSTPDAGLVITTRLDVRIFWIGVAPFTPHGRWEMRIGTQRAAVASARVTRVVDAATLGERHDLAAVPSHDVAEVTLELARPLVVDPTGAARSLSRFVLVDTASALGEIVGGGVIVSSTPAETRASGVTAPLRAVTTTERRQRAGHSGAVVWLTGLSGAGKSTLAVGLERALFDRGRQVVVLDGDRLRFGLNADLGFSPEDRRENIRRAAEVAALFAATGAVAITAFISPYAADRANARAIAAAAGVSFIEVFVDASLAECERRDAKGLYAKARAGQLGEFTGISAPYEAPTEPEVVVRTEETTPEAGVAHVLGLIVGEP